LPSGTFVPQSILDPVGPVAASIEQLWWVLFWVLTVILVLVSSGILYALFRRRPDEDPGDPMLAPDDGRPLRWVLTLGVGVSGVILTGLFVHSLVTLRQMHDRPPADVTIDVTGWDWWWEIRYITPAGDTVRSANEIHVPVGREVELRLRSGDVIHSLWIPRLAGKVDLIPGRTTAMHVRADRPGVLRGQCAEYCGVQHTNMGLMLVASAPSEYEAWLAREAAPALEPAAGSIEARGRDIFTSSACASCHSVRGTSAAGTLGPDLTHVASRLTLGAGVLSTTHASMAGWIANPQQLKPGNLMPSVPLPPADLRALTAYMMSLH